MKEKNPYEFGIHPAVKMLHAWTASLQAKTSKTLGEWVNLVKNSGTTTQKEQKAWLKEHFKFGTLEANRIVEIAAGEGWGSGSPESYLQAAHGCVEAMFTGPKESLRPIYEAVLSLGYGLGEDVKACPCKTIIPLYRHHVFAQVKATTRKRIDLGLALGNLQTPPRLIHTGGYEKKDRITHSIPLTQLDEVDDEVKHWLTVAYRLDV